MGNLNMAPYFTAQGYGQEQLKYILHPIKMHDYNLLHDIDKTVELIKKAKKIAVIGDYDFDGISATTIIVKTLQIIKKEVIYFIPNRFTDGYGLNVNLVKKSLANGADTILTVDNGIAALDSVKYAKEQGLTVIVTDHHSPKETLPVADAIVHPALPPYPFKDISGCQVSYKLSQRLFHEYKVYNEGLQRYFLQLSGLSIVSDVMPVASKDMEKNENRLWIQQCIDSLNKTPDLHFQKLMEAFDFVKVDETVLGFYLIPCINAIGRLEDATYAVDYFLNNPDYKYVEHIIETNEKRKNMVKEQMETIQVLKSPKELAVIELGENINEGIIGLIAGRYCSGFGTVSLCFTKVKKGDNFFYKASGRNDTSMSLFEILSSMPQEYFAGWGGHKDACGLTVKEEYFEKFKEEFFEIVDKSAVPNKPFVMKVSYDQLPTIKKFAKELKPFGQGLAPINIETNLYTKEVLTTLSGFCRIQSQDDINMWSSNVNSSFIERLDSNGFKNELPSGTIIYNAKTNVKVKGEISFSPSKGNEELEYTMNVVNEII